ncbi:DUF6225 family protein (plasmid) [Streptomyces sp. NBC_01591]|uniref:DUF6225 family protein n=1 Tax=Streptomyces sp. NBC_01591 TaxID=2975888 RepID=UPI002DDA2FD1|nr:DUF6225 family protein [Streptomyces sp. NBC_01591]WSD74404.1 DUF6225 family protein [Streptomyces sp. NBC_01591]
MGHHLDLRCRAPWLLPRPTPDHHCRDRRDTAFEHTPQVWNAAQLRDAIKDLPDDAPVHICVAGDPGWLRRVRDFVLVDAHQVENWWPATSTAPERTETAEALFADWEPGAYDHPSGLNPCPPRRLAWGTGSGGVQRSDTSTRVQLGLQRQDIPCLHRVPGDRSRVSHRPVHVPPVRRVHRSHR